MGLKMKGVWFGNLHSYENFGLILSETIISSPKIKTKQIKVPGMDGVIDLTEFDGNIHYYNRTIKFVFSKDRVSEYWNSIRSEINNKIHGKEMDIIMDEDAGFIWHGRVNVKEQKKDGRVGTIEIEVDAAPYKQNRFTSIEEGEWDTFDLQTGIMQCLKDLEINGKTQIEVFGYRQNVVPVIHSEGTVSLICNDIPIALDEGKNKFLNVVIKEGKNILLFEGTGIVSIEFRGGSL